MMSTLEPSYDVQPLIVPADAVCTISVRPHSAESRFEPTARYEVLHYPCEQLGPPSTCTPAALQFEGGRLLIRAHFPAEQEHVLLLRVMKEGKPENVKPFRVYSLREDLFGRRPFKGDFHIHSNRSDGREPPAHVAAACRRIGMDFVAVTDHGRYAPSLEAIRAFGGMEMDFRIFPGEEVHPPRNPVHMINFGGRFSINDLFADEAAYLSGVAEVERTLGDLPIEGDRYPFASSVWCFNKIREAGGLGIFCHPYWFVGHRYEPSGPLTSLLFTRRPFDAFELIGGYRRFELESNTLQAARYHEERLRGGPMPVVGVSDAHGCNPDDLFGWYYTIVFSPSTELADLIESVKGGYSVAVEAPPGELARPHGPFRLVKFARFLLREFFPGHDALCVEEGDRLLAHANGDATAAAAMPRLRARSRAWNEGVWARP
jgi:hypothetical protein